MIITRRNALFMFAAPAIVRATSIMPVKALALVPRTTFALDIEVIEAGGIKTLYLLGYNEYGFPITERIPYGV